MQKRIAINSSLTLAEEIVYQIDTYRIEGRIMMRSVGYPAVATMALTILLVFANNIQTSISFQLPSYKSISSPATSPYQYNNLISSSHTYKNSILTSLFAKEGGDDDCDCPDDNNGPDILQPYLPAMDPKYSVNGPISEGMFKISRSGGPTTEELTNEQMLAIVTSECNDLEVNTLVWKCLGYRYNEEENEWTPSEVFPKWKERYPNPPDFIGMKRVYSKEVDQDSLTSNQALVRSIPAEFKQSLKPTLKPLGWTGFQMKGLTPNKTRRAQCANWLIFYREELFGYTIEELKEKRRLKAEAEAAAEAKRKEEGAEEEWKPPVKEVF